MALTAHQVRNAKPGRHSDGGGLTLLVKPSGAKSWALRVQHNGTRTDYGLGSVTLDPIHADIPIHRRKLLTLAEAREKARIGRALAKAGINPSEHWREAALEASREEEALRSFREAAKECHAHSKKGWREGKHADEWLSSLERHVFDLIGSKAVTDIDANDVERVLMPIWLEKPETARKIKQRIGAVLDYAHAKNWREAEAPMRAVQQLMKKIKQPKAKNFPAMPHKEVPAFMAKLRAADFSVGRAALQFFILTTTRPGVVRKAKWSEIDLERAEWSVPAKRMKMDKDHIVPLVPAAIDILKKMQELFPSQPDDLIFPGLRSKPLSDVTLTKVLRVHGGVGFTVHGFRSSFRDWAAENGYNNDWAEAAIAHSVAGQEGKTIAAYKRTTYFEHRRDRLMPSWASFVLGENSNVVSLAERRA